MSRAKRSSSALKPPKKRVKVSDPASDNDEGGASESTKAEGTKTQDLAPSTSPPPEPPSERFMDEGFDRDDKYRMVEDEFLSIAQRFTVHLHTAEYKRQEKMVKTRNAEAINSILRPVTSKMPDHTKRKVESVARSKSQRAALQTLLLKNPGEGDESDDSDGDGLPYVGTTLHGLMDSPRGKSKSLATIRSPGAATRAAAGFQGPAARRKAFQNLASRSPVSKAARSHGIPNPEDDVSTESSDGDDDLDAPILAPKVASFNRGSAPVRSKYEGSRSALTPSASKTMESFATSRLTMKTTHTESLGSKDRSSKPVPLSTEASRIELESKSRIVLRLEKARLQRAKQEKEDQDRKKLDVIPTFL